MPQRRANWIALGACLLVLVTAAGLSFLRGSTSALTEEDAVARFRAADTLESGRAEDPAWQSASSAEATAAPASGAGNGGRAAATIPSGAASDVGRAVPSGPAGDRRLPDAGVYTYATTGGEEVDVFGGSRHDYPEQTTITIRHAGCGLVERWDALRERWDEKETCPTPRGERLVRTTAYHEFFRQGDARDMRCDEQSLSWPADVADGATWQARCTAENAEVVSSGRIVGREVMDVGGERVEAVRAVTESTVKGSQTGSSRTEVWRQPATGLVLRQRSQVTTSGEEPVVGTVTYTESYEIKLTRLTPRT